MFSPYLKYAAYLIRHCWYVRKMCWKNGLYWQGLVHDLSKWRPSEFIPYARFFYGDFPPMDEVKHIPHLYSGRVKEQVAYEFDVAWLLHQKRNPHHWQFWILHEDDGGEKVLPMPEKYVKEMLCDWWGASVATGNGGKSKDWYEKVKKHTKMHAETRAYFEKAIQNSPTPYILPPL
jgi:hypothetical protein